MKDDGTAPSAVEEAATFAAGLGAVKSTAAATLRMGVVRGTKLLLDVNQQKGFDCPGCAWPERPTHRSTFEFCENGAKHVADEACLGRAGEAFFREHAVADLAERSDQWLNDQGRLVQPMLLDRGATHYAPVSWDDAFAVVAEELRALASPDEAIFYTSGRTSNEAAFLYQAFARLYGTNNLPDCSNMCHESSGAALNATLGVGKATVTLDDFDRADAIFVFGQNPGSNHPRMLAVLEAARRRGCEIVSVNPLREAGLLRFAHPQQVEGLLGRGQEISSHYVQVRVNGDVPLVKALMKRMLAEGAIDREFIAEHTSGFEAFEAALARHDYDDLVRESGADPHAVDKAARIAMRSERTIACWAMGLTQHKNGVANVQEIVNFLLLRGNVGKPGAGACPVRGHSNVQGDRTMGIWEKMPDAFLDRLGAALDFEPPRRHGYDTVEAIRAMDQGRARVFFAMGGNFLSAAPDTERTARALARCRLTAHVATKLNRSHVVTGERALLLPCLGRTERDEQAAGLQFVTVENSMGQVHPSRGGIEPASKDLLSEPAIVAGLAAATLGVDWSGYAADYDRVRELIARVVDGCADYGARVREPGGFLLPNGARERRWRTSDGRAQFTVHDLPRHELGAGQVLMMTIRSHDQFNTTVYGPDDRYRGVFGGRRVVFMNADDASERGLRGGDLVDLVSHFRGEERVAPRFTVVPYDIPRACVATYFPEANVLVPLDATADVSNTPASKSIVVSLRRSDA